MIERFLSFFLFFFILIFKLVSFFFKKKNEKLIFVQDRVADLPNVRLKKISFALNKHSIYPVLLIHKDQLKNFELISNNFEKIFTYNSYLDLIIFTLKNKNSIFNFFTEVELISGLLINICKPKKFFFDNYDQLYGIHKDFRRVPLEKYLITNSFNICRSGELKLIKKKNKHIFFPDYFLKLRVDSNLELRQLKNNHKIKIVYGGQIRESYEWGQNNYNHNHEDIIKNFGNFKNIILDIFPTQSLSQESRKDYKKLCEKYENVNFNESLPYNDFVEKLSEYDFGISITPTINKKANIKNKYSMANKIFDYLSNGVMILYPKLDFEHIIKPYEERFLKHYGFFIKIDLKKSENEILEKLKKFKKNVKINNLNNLLIDNHIKRLINFYGLN